MRNDLRWLVVSLALMVVLAVVMGLNAAAPPAPDLSVHSDDRNGAMALQLWLRRSGFDTREVYRFDTLADIDVLFVLQPLWFFYSAQDGQTLRRWVQQGGTLIVAGDPEATNMLLSAFDVELRYLAAADEYISPAAPSLPRPLAIPLKAEAFARIHSQRVEFTPHLFSGEYPVLASSAVGDGRAWIAGLLRPFTNHGLSDSGAALLISSLLPGSPRDVVIGFDEGGHGFTDPAQSSLGAWLFSTPAGWSVLAGVLVTLTYLASRGQRFGRPLPLPDERLRRDSVEYIQAIGSLFRRSGQRVEILKHYNGQLRRRLSERYGVDPALPAADMVKAIVYRDPSIDETALRPLLQRLAQSKVSEHDLVQIASEVDTFLRSIF